MQNHTLVWTRTQIHRSILPKRFGTVLAVFGGGGAGGSEVLAAFRASKRASDGVAEAAAKLEGVIPELLPRLISNDRKTRQNGKEKGN